MSIRMNHPSRKYQLRQRLQPTIAPLTAAIGTALAAGSLHAATITVDTLDEGIPSGACSLRGALYAASSNGTNGGACPAGDIGRDTIVFDSALSGTIVLDADGTGYYDGSTLPIGESVTIDGDERITIQGTGAAPVLYQKYDSAAAGFTAEEVELRGLTITGGGGDRGGAIRSRGEYLEIRNCTLTGNTTVSAGGAIWHSHPLSVISTLTIFNSVISGNETTANGSRGGAIAVDTASHDLNIYFTTLENNTSQGSGGALDWRAGNGSLALNNSTTFNGNSAKYGDGGAVNVVSSGAYGVFLVARDSLFSNNIATEHGGAIAIQDSGSGEYGFGDVRLRGATFQNNAAGGNGGGIRVVRGDGNGTTGAPENFVRTEASPYTSEPTLFIDNSAAYSGGAAEIIVGDATPIELYGADFLKNTAFNGNGGAAVISTGNSGLVMSEITVEGNTAEGNTADGTGRGAGFDITANNAGDVEGKNVEFLGNYGEYGGGMKVEAYGGDVLLEDARFVNNTAASSFGGGLQVTGTLNQFGIGSSVFSGNSAVSGGGGLDVFAPGSENVLVELKYSEWSGNDSNERGGAINLQMGTGSQVFLKNSTLSGNTSGTSGGAVSTFGDQQLMVKYSTVADNIAGYEGGGVITNQTGACSVYNTLFDGNTGANGAEEQDLRTATATPCSVENSLLSGADSEFTDAGGNVLYQDPMLLPLADNGGTNGRTHALGAGSPAIDAGVAGTNVPDFDQRGGAFQRVFGTEVDMGAYEVQPLQDAIFSDRFEAP